MNRSIVMKKKNYKKKCYRNCVYCSYLVRFNTDKIDIGFYHLLSDLFTLDCTAHNTHNYVILSILNHSKC